MGSSNMLLLLLEVIATYCRRKPDDITLGGENEEDKNTFRISVLSNMGIQ